MLSSNGNPYLRPEYLNPPPTTMDSKKSPLALLAQTCSQIGSDPLTPPVSTANSSSTVKPAQPERKKSVGSESGSKDKMSPPLSVGGGSIDLSSKSKPNEEPIVKASKKESARLTPSREAERRSKSSSPKNPSAGGGRSSENPATVPAPLPLNHPAYSLMMPGADPMASYKSLMAAGMAGSPYSPASSFPPYYPGAVPGYPPGLDLGAYASQMASLKAASMPPPPHLASGYYGPGVPSSYSAALALQYSRMAAAASQAGGPKNTVSSDGCRDPFCTGCPASGVPSVHMICPVGCGLGVQCDHPKVPVPAHLAGPPAVSPGSSTTATRPYICNWIAGGDAYCGKRFATSEDLLQHLRTHTNLSTAVETSSSSASTTSSSGHPAFAHPSLRAYPTPPLSPLSAARYHPYRPNGQSQPPVAPPQQTTVPPSHPAAGLLHPAAGAGAYPSALFHPAMASYYSHLSLFGPRGLGSSASLPP